MTILFNIFHEKKITDDFRGLHKNMNCAFPLKAAGLFNYYGLLLPPDIKGLIAYIQ